MPHNMQKYHFHNQIQKKKNLREDAHAIFSVRSIYLHRNLIPIYHREKFKFKQAKCRKKKSEAKQKNLIKMAF